MTVTWSSSLRARDVRVALALHAILALALCFLPLFDGLGFERAFATGLLASLTSPAIAFGVLRVFRAHGGADPGAVATRALALGGLQLLPSAVAGWLVEQFSTSCNQQAGLLFLLLVAGGNVLFTTSIGLLAGALTPRAPHAAGVVAVVLGGFLYVALAGLYTDPQIFVFSAPFGYWPGSLYDEALDVTSSLWAFRGYTLLYTLTALSAFGALVSPARLRLGTRFSVGYAATTVLAGLATWQLQASGSELGFDLDSTSVQRALSRRLETDHFIIFADPSLPRTQARRLELEHELRYSQLTEFFGDAPEGKITSYVYANAQQKGELMGAAGTQIARPWAREIHIHGFDVPHRVLKHELAHIFAGALAPPPFNVPSELGVLVNMGIVEGVAVAADWPAHELTIHGWTRAMRSLGLAPDLRKMLNPMGFWAISSSRAYTVAGSFVRFLYDTYGREPLSALYGTNDFERAYGKPLEALVTEWESFIDALPLPKREMIIAEHRFKRPSIFQRTCAREAANVRARGYARLRSGDIEGALEDLETLARFRRNDPGPWADMADALARHGRLEEAETRVAQALSVPNATQKARARAVEAKASVAWRRGDVATASAAYASVLDQHLSTPSVRLQQARISAMDRPDPMQSTLRAQLLSDLSFSAALVRLGALAVEHPEDGLVQYLYARALERAGTYPEGVDAMRRALAHELPSAEIRLEAALSLGRLELWSGAPRRAEARFRAITSQPLSDAKRLEAVDWAERAKFWAEREASAPGK